MEERLNELEKRIADLEKRIADLKELRQIDIETIVKKLIECILE